MPRPHSTKRYKLQQQALDLRIKGFSYRAIAKQMGVTEQNTFALVNDALQEIIDVNCEKAAQLRTIETERLDVMLLALEPKIAQGEYMAIAAALKIQERRAKLWGLDKPEAKPTELQTAIDQFVALQSDSEDTIHA